MKKITLASLAILTTTLSFGQAKLIEKVTKKGGELIIPYEKYVLPNGLTVILHEDHSDPVVHVDVTYHVGSAREQINKSGFAHFFEHMMFEGSDHALKGTHDKITIGNGGTNNGTTNRDRTNYYETEPKNVLEQTLWLEADRMGFLLGQVTQERFEVQRATVKNERGQKVDNRPYGLTSEYTYKNLYPYGHPYSWLTIGYMEDLDRANVNDLKNFFLRWYGPNNATLSIGGDINPAATVKMVEKYFGAIPRGPAVTPVKVPAVSLAGNRYVSYTDNYARVPLLSIMYPTVPNYDKDMVALMCLAQVLGKGKNSVLYQNLVKKQLALDATVDNIFAELSGELSVMLFPLGNKTLAEMEELYNQALTEFEKRGITDDDLEKFKGSAVSDLVSDLQNVSGKVSRLAQYQTFTGNPNKIKGILEMYNSLTKADVMRAYHTYIKGKGAVIVSVLPKAGNIAPAKPDNFTIDQTKYTAPDYGYDKLTYKKASDNFDRRVTPPLQAVPVVKAPVVWQKQISGAKVIGINNAEVPMVNISVTIPGGRLSDAKDLSKAGVAAVFASMMREDTKNYTAEQMAVELQKLGSTLTIVSGVDGTQFSIWSLKKNLSKTMALVQERLLNPKFTQEAFDRQKQQRLGAFKQQKGEPSAIAPAVFDKINFGANNILGLPAAGTEKTVANITLADIEQHYKDHITAAGARIIVVGDINETEAETQLAFLNKLPKTKVVVAAPAPAIPVTKTKIYMVDVPKAAQTQFLVGYANGLTFSPVGESYAIDLADYPMGGSFTGRLNTYMRETKGWTYGASSGFGNDLYSGKYQFNAGIRAASTDSALVALIDQYREYSKTGPTADELTFLKKAMGQSEALRYEALYQKANFASQMLTYNLQPNYLEQQAAQLKGATSAQLKAIANKYMDIDKMNILLVGDKARILPELQKHNYEIVELDVDGNPAN
ncbi:M16 family metallopeptidase [Mucilaginibacter myungsuensis]|uniref:Insulinase family protein n=1 Tax=Mucilaginibacter myungsuensis TaxID=649104 RepID=A0A929PXN7_9SPHI|nr:pitrilysin family protein [Mucilaginibacter myungsuensis]MBE9663366.1 insulinase family protein [Mucilaginibacter myungsuensis]MDN3600103.1 pitrilysin family protein [Mucilaginibacter myungsuensis]